MKTYKFDNLGMMNSVMIFISISLGLSLVVLKLTGLIDLSWWLVVLPFWVYHVTVLVVMGIIIAIRRFL